MPKIKLIAIDIGGTLIDDNNNIPLENIKILKKVKKQGLKIALVTARMLSSTKYISNVIECDYGVYGNGSNIIDINNNELLYLEKLSNRNLERLINFGKKEGLYIHLNQVFQEVSDEEKYFALKHLLLNKQYPSNLRSNIKIVPSLKDYINSTDNIVKLVYVSKDNLDSIKEKISKEFPDVFITEYNTNLNETAINEIINYIEIGAKASTKAEGVKKLANILNLSQEEILVIGDGNNDIEMFKSFKNSGCLKNGTSEAKANANYVSKKTNNEGGLSEIIEYYLNKEVE